MEDLAGVPEIQFFALETGLWALISGHAIS
jgi:hypothetical protein